MLGSRGAKLRAPRNAPGIIARPVPIYEYRCNNGHTFEVTQRMSDAPVTKCEECGAPVERVFHPVAVHFKGKGFYTTDYGSASKSKPAASESEESKSGSDSKESGSGDKGKAKSSSGDGGS